MNRHVEEAFPESASVCYFLRIVIYVSQIAGRCDYIFPVTCFGCRACPGKSNRSQEMNSRRAERLSFWPSEGFHRADVCVGGLGNRSEIDLMAVLLVADLSGSKSYDSVHLLD